MKYTAQLIARCSDFIVGIVLQYIPCVSFQILKVNNRSFSFFSLIGSFKSLQKTKYLMNMRSHFSQQRELLFGIVLKICLPNVGYYIFRFIKIGRASCRERGDKSVVAAA